MAKTLTSNLKLIIADGLTSDAKINLNKIDNLGSLYQVNANADAIVRSQRNIILQPNDPDIGGSGTGGTIQIGTTDQPATTITLNATTTTFNGTVTSSTELCAPKLSVTNSGFTLGILAPTLSSSFDLTLPASTGIINQVLTTDGTGTLSWTTVAGTGSFGAELTETWSVGDGTSKTITHNFGTRNIIVQVMDPSDSYRTVEVDEVTRPTDNSIVLSSSMAPSAGWTILLKQVTN